MDPYGSAQSSSLQHFFGVGTQAAVGTIMLDSEGARVVGTGEGAFEGLWLGKCDGELLG